jgi:hypothetical protein
MNKKYFLLLLLIPVIIIAIIFTVWIAKGEPKLNETTTEAVTAEQSFESVTDAGIIEIEKEYTLNEILQIKTNWNKEYAFPCDIEKVQITNNDEQNITMSLTTDKCTYSDAVSFYNKYTKNKEQLNSTSTQDTFFVSFVDCQVSRTISVVKDTQNIIITITYSLENTNKR